MHPPHDLRRAIAAVTDEPDIVRALRNAEVLTIAAAWDDGPVPALADLLAEGDDLAAIAAVHALSRVVDDAADVELVAALGDPRPPVREHAAWALSARIPAREALTALWAMVAAGGFAGMLAQRTLVGWGRSDADGVTLAGLAALSVTADPPARARLVETLGEVPGEALDALLLAVAADEGRDTVERAVAVAAVGARSVPSAAALLTRLAGTAGPLSTLALLALDDLDLGSRDGDASARSERARGSGGLRVGQLYVHAELDPDVAVTTGGDRGGIATLLVSLGRALAADPHVDHVLTIGRGTVDDALVSLLEPPGDGATFAAVPVGLPGTPPPPVRDAWPQRLQLERDVRRVLRRRPRLDVLHLRLADVGTLAAAAAARRLGVPVAFTLAPDPHGPIRAAQAAGRLDRAGFGDADAAEHLWFRSRMVERLAGAADRVAVFPRPRLAADLRQLTGFDVEVEADRVAAVPEGIDLAAVRRATGRVVAGGGAAVADLRAAVDALPPARRGRPLLVTIGRLDPIKGIDRVVAAWAGDERLAAHCNLVVVGGDLERPSAVEAGVLAAIQRHAAGRHGLVLLGRRDHDEALAVLAAARHGAGSAIAPGGVYADGALKEEFGLAVVEALATGLPVVAPAAGAPATYVEDGRTGVLVDAAAPLAPAIRQAFELVGAAGRAGAARRLVEERYTIEAMAGALVGLYRRSALPVRG